MGGAEQSRIRNKGQEVSVRLCEVVIVPMTLYRAEAWGMRSAEKESECSSDEVFEKLGWSVMNG